MNKNLLFMVAFVMMRTVLSMEKLDDEFYVINYPSNRQETVIEDSEYQEPELWSGRHEPHCNSKFEQDSNDIKQQRIIESVQKVVSGWKCQYEEGQLQVEESKGEMDLFETNLKGVNSFFLPGNQKVNTKDLAAALKYEYVGQVESSRQEKPYSTLCDLMTPTGTPALCNFVWHQYTALAALAICVGADINQKDQYGTTPFLIAMSYGNDALCTFLMNHGAHMAIPTSVSGFDRVGTTALNHAFYRRDEKWIENIVKQYPEAIHIQDDSGQTVLHYCCDRRVSSIFNAFEKIKTLLDYGARLDLVDNNGFTPLDLLKKSSLRDGDAVVCVIKELFEKRALAATQKDQKSVSGQGCVIS